MGDVDLDATISQFAGISVVGPPLHSPFESVLGTEDALLEVTLALMDMDVNAEPAQLGNVAAGLNQWTQNFNSFRSSQQHLAKTQTQTHTQTQIHNLSILSDSSAAALEMRMLYLSTVLAVRQARSPRPLLAWDVHVDACRQMVQLGGIALGGSVSSVNCAVPSLQQQRQQQQCRFTFELGVIPILFYVSAFCRDPVVRRAAVQMVMEARIQDGVWSSMLTGRVAERMMNLEEGAVAGVVRTCADVPEDVRIHECLVFIDPYESRARVQYKCGNRCWQEVVMWEEVL